MEDNNQLVVDAMWEDLHNKGYFQKDKDTFDKFFFAPGEEGYNNRYKLWKDLHNKGYLESPTYEDFAARIGLQPVQKETTALNDVQGTVMGGVAGGVEPGSYAQNFAYGLQEGADKNISLEGLRSDLETRRQKKAAEVQEQQDAAVGNVKQNEPEKSTIFGGGSSAGGGASTSSSRKSNIGYNKYTGILKTDPTTGEKYYTYPGYSQAQDTTNISELQGNNMVDEEGRVIGASGGTWSPKYIDDRNRLFLPGSSIWLDGTLKYRTPLDNHIAQAIDLGMKASDHSNMSVDQLKAKRNEILGKYSNGFTSSPESLQDAIDLNDIDYELTARSLNYNSKKEMLANRGHADFELNKARVNQDDLRFYERQGTNLDQNPLYVFGWQKLVDKIQNDQKMGMNANMTADGYIDYLMQDPNIESKFYAYTLYRASKNNRSWKENIDEVLDDFRQSLEKGENKHALAPDEKDVMAQYYGGELDRMDAEYEKELEAWQERVNKWSANRNWGGWEHDRLGIYSAETGDDTLSLITTAQNLSKDARNIINEGMKSNGGFSLSGEVGALTRGFANSAFDWRTWTFGVSDLHDNANMYNVAKKWGEGKQLTKAEQLLLDQMLLKTASEEFFKDYLTTGYEAGQTTGYALEFIVEMMTGAGAATDAAVRAMGTAIKKLGKKKVVQLLERIGMKSIIEGTLKKLGRSFEKVGSSKIGKVIQKGAKAGGKVLDEAISVANKGLGQTFGPGIAKVPAGAYEGTTGQVKGRYNPKTGRMEVTGFDNIEDFFTSTIKSAKRQFGENASEFLGDRLFDPGIKFINNFYRKASNKAFKKFGMENAREFLDSLKGSDWYRFTQDFRKQIHYNGSFGEYCEEVANNIYNAAFVGDQNFNSPDDPNSVFNFKQNWRTYASCKFMSLAFGTANVIGYRTPKYRAKKDIDRADEIAKRAFRGLDWGSIAASIRNGSDEQVQQLMVDIARSKKYNARQREAAIKYAGAVYALKGIEAGEPKKTPDTPAEGQLKEMYGRGYNMENYQAISDANGAYERAKQGVAWIPPEMLQMIDEEPAYVYEWVANNPNWSEQEKQQLFDYLNAKATYEGAQARLKDDETSIRADVESGIDQRTNKKNEDGTGGDNMIHPVVLKNGKRVYVTGGNVEQDSQGKVTSDTNDLIVVDEDNNTSMITSKDIETVEEVESPDEQKQVANDAITQGLAETTGATATDDAVVDEDVEQGGEGADGAGAVGNYDGVLDAMGIEDDQARQALNETWGQTPPADAMDVLNDLMGENNPEQRESNKEYWAQQPEVFNSQWRYMMGDVTPDQVNAALAAQNEASAAAAAQAPAAAQGQAQVAPQAAAAQSQPQPSTPTPQAAATPGHYEQDDDVVLNVGGEQITGFISNVTPDGKLRLQLDAPIDGNMVIDVTPEELDKMVAQPQSSGESEANTATAAAPAPQPAQAAAPEAPQQESAQPSLPVGEDGNADFSNATPQEAHDYIYNDPELDEEEANQVVQNYADSAAEELAKAQAVLDELKSMPAPQMKDYGRDMAGYKRDKKERNDSIAQAQAAVDAAQREVDLWNDVQTQHMMASAPDVTNQGAPASEEGNVESGEVAAPAAPQETAGETQAPAPQEESSMLSANESGEPSSTQTNEGESGEETAPAEEELTPDERIERARMEALENRAEELAESCGLPVQVARSLDDLSDSHRRQVEKQHAEGKYVNGFYDPKTKQIVLFLPDIAKNGGMRRLERTFLHEGVAHGGLRALFENAPQNGIQTFDDLCDQVWEMMPVVAQAQMMNYIGVQKPEDMTQEKKRIAADEYMAHLAEWGVEQSVKTRIINAIKNALRKIGIKMRLNNNDIVSLLAASRRNLNEMDKVGINSAISEAMDNDGEGDGEGVRMSTTAIFEGAGLEVSRDATDNEGKPTKEPLTDSKGNLVARYNGKEYSAKNPITADDLREGDVEGNEATVLQMLINDARGAMNISDEQAAKIYQNYADLINMYLYTGSAELGGPDTVKENWEWLGDSVFRTIAANGDAQYSYSMDIIRVCKKNEAVIKAMSALQLREGRGATPSEIVELYRETHEDGYQVPCPVCYVFTRYIRNGKYASAAIKGMEKWGDHLPGGSDVWNVNQWLDALDKIQRETNPDYKPDGKNKMKGEELEKAKRFKKQLDQANKITVAYEKRVNALSYLLTTDDAIKAGTIKNKVLELTPERRASIEKELEIINEQYQHAVEIIAHQALSNWIKTHAIEEKDGKWQMREDARKPEDIDDYKRNALDLRLTSNTIVNYPAIQRLRKSGGSAAGKEISFASDNRLGEVVSGLGINKTNLSGYKNKYEEALNATGRAKTKARNEARKRFKDATVYALMQTLRGGQRMWSWSDNIERLSPDIAINIMQLQLLGGAMQTYSKQLEGIKLAAQMGAYVNGSLMAKDNGYQEVTDKDVEERDGKLWLNHDITDEVEEYPVGGGEPKPRKRIVAAKGSYVYQAQDGKKYVLIYDDVVGVDPFGNELHGKGKKKGLFQLNQEYDRAGNILVGMNDLHVRAAMADPRVFFIIPWHASGANNHILNQMLNILEQTMTDRLDYTAMQEEKNMLERNKNTKELPEVNQRLRDLWEEGRQWAEQNKWKSGMEVDSNGDVITESQYMYRQLRAQIFNGNIFEAMPSEEQYRAAVQTVESMQPTVDAIAARNEAWKAKSSEYKKSPEGKAEKKAIERDKNRTNKKYKEALHYIELHDGLIDWRDSSQHEGDAEWQAQHPKRINVEEARRMIENDEFLSQVLKRVEPIGHMTNGDNTYIYPYEYWQETDEKGNPADIKDADINGKRYVEYCRRMGYKPKFSGRWGDKVTEENMNDGNFVHDPGYWKLLIDRRMYDRNGKYQWLDPVESENFEPDLVNPLKTGEEFNITQVADDKDAEDIAERVYNNMAERDGGVAKVDYSKPLEKIMDEYDAALAAGVQANVKLTDAEEDALEDMEEAMEEEGGDSGVMFSTSPTFYSNAERAVEGVKQNKATAEQWKAMLTKAGGIKSGEDKWMGLSTWLDENKGKSLTKDKVLQFVRDNGIQMEEVNYGEGLDGNAIYNRYGLGDYNFDGEPLPWTEWFDLSPNGVYFQGDQDDRFQLAEIVNNQDHFVNPKGYDLNKTEGKENFIKDVEENLFKFIQKEKPTNGNTINSMRLPYTTDGLENKREIAFVVPNVEPYQVHDEVHFGPENQGKAVMWVRFGETTDADGKRVLVIDEIQSNRHQGGREKGYKRDLTEAEKKELKDLGKRYDDIQKQKRENSRNVDVLGRLTNEEWDIVVRMQDLSENGVPAAPFEKNWHEVAMKRMLRLAAEEGFDKVAWTTGEQQAARYGLEKVLSSINSSDWGDNIGIEDTKVVTLDYKSGDAEDLIVNRNGEIVADVDDRFNNNTLADVVGKEMADKLLVDGEVAISGNGLRIGGEGMKGFYDKMLPRFMDKYGKRWGVKTGTVELPNVEEAGRTMHSVDVTPEMKESVMQGQPLFSVSDVNEAMQEAEVDGVPAYEANNLRFSVLDPERDADLIAELDDQEYVTVYRTMAKVNGEYYPPMDSRDHDNPEKLRNPEKLGQYTQSEERPDLAYAEEYIDKKTGEKKTRWKFNLKKSNGKSVDGVAYNPYMHTSDSALNDQFSEAQDRDDLVVVECRVPVSELDPNSYHAEKALDPVGWKPWKAGPIVSKMTGKRNLLLSRWVKPVKELSWSEVADMVSKQLGDQFDVLPSNTFSKGLRAELEKRGYQFIETDNKGIIKSGLYKGVTWSDRYYDIHPEKDNRSNKKQKRAKVAEAKARNAEAGEGARFSTSGEVVNVDKIDVGISINDGYGVNFTDLILSGKKTIETRNKRTLDPFIGEWVGLIRTGKGKATLVGYIKLGEPISYTPENFNDDYDKHYVKSSDKKFFNNGNKYGYPIIDVIPIDPIKLDSYSPLRKYKNQQGTEFNVSKYVARHIPNNKQSQALFSTTAAVDALKDDERVYNDLLGKVFSGVSNETRRGIVGDAMENRGYDFGAATEAWLMGLADDEAFAQVPQEDWRAVKNALGNALRENGVEGSMTDNEARYVLWKAGQIEDGVFSMAKDIVKRDELLNGASAPQYTDNADVRFSTSPAEQIYSDNFKNWFGDWENDPENASKVVDKDGRPLVVYRGGEKINVFEPDRANRNAMYGQAFYATPSYADAQGFAKERTGDGGNVQAVYLDVRNPWVDGPSESLGYPKEATTEQARELVDLLTQKGLVNGGIILAKWNDGRVRSLIGSLSSAEYEGVERGKFDWWHASNIVQDALKELGYDGVIGRFDSGDGMVDQIAVFSPTQIKSATENNGDFSRENPDIRFSVTPRDRAIARDQYDRMMRSGRYQFAEAVQDSMLGLKKLMEAIMGDSYEYIEDIPMYENPYITENLMSSSNAAQQHEYSNRLMAPILKEINKLTKGKNKARNELIDYMMAKHGLERNQVLADRDAQETAAAGGNYQDAYAENRERDYAGLTALTGEDDVHAAEAKAQQMVDDYEAQHDTTELWNKVNAATKTTLAKLYQCGIMSKETYQKTRDMFEYYIPLRGWDEKTSDKVYGYLTSKDGPLTGGSIMKRAGGRTSKADDPIATIAMMADKAIREGNRNLMKQTFLNFVRNHPSDAVSVSELWLQYDATKDEWVPVFPKIPADATPAEVEQITEQFEADMQQLAQQEPDKYKHGRETANIPYKVIPGNEREHQVLVKMRGQTYVLTINGNPRAAQAINGLTNPDTEATKVIGKILEKAQAINRGMSAVYTTMNPDFVVSNFLRDMYYANTMVYVKEKGNYGVRFNANVAKLNPLTIYYLLQKWENGTLNENRRIEKLFKEFMLNGGETGYTTVWDVERYKKSIDKELRKQNNIALKAMGTLGGQLEMFNRSVENVARFAAFVTSVEMGRSYGRAAYDAKEISVNFNKKGSGGTMFGATGQTFLGNVGAAVSSVGRQFFVFWNAGVQGMTNFGRNTKRHPVKGGLGAASLFGLGILIPLLAGAGGGDGDDEDKNAYYNLPEYIRRSNLCIYADGKWVTIPLPVEYRAIYGLGELAYGVVAGKERYSDEELAMQISSQFSQLLPIDMLEGGGGWHPFIPTLLKPIVETGTNTSWSGLPIHPDSPFDDGKYMPEYTKVYQSTDKDLIKLSEFLNRVTGGNGRKKGMVDINPANIEYWLNGYLGGLFTFPIKVKKSAETAFGDREFEWKNIPFANRVIKEGDERTEAKKLKNEFFKYKEEYEETKWRLQGYGKDTDQGVFNYAKELADMNYSKEYGRYVIFDKYAKDFEDLEKIKKRIADGTLPAEMKQEYDAEDMRLKRQLVQEMHAYEDGKYTPDKPKAEDQYKPKEEETKVTIQKHASSFDEVRMVDEFSNTGNQYKPANNDVMVEAQKLGMKMRYYKQKNKVKHELGLSGSTWNLDGDKSAEKKRFYNSHKALLDRVGRYRWREREIGRLMDEAKEKKSKEASNYKRIYQIIQDDIKDEEQFQRSQKK